MKLKNKSRQKTRTVSRTVSEESVIRTVIRILNDPQLRPAALRSVFLIFKNFFFLQYMGAFFPGHHKTTRADHPLDEKIPFRPDKVEIYLDFVQFYIRALGFLIDYSRKIKNPRDRTHAAAEILNLINSLGNAYSMAAEVYSKNFSTTNRPRYLSRFKFLVIHVFDPHLMCIPSLHVMVMILTYTRFKKLYDELRRCVASEDEQESFTEEVRSGALAITEAVLYIKQHSVNCISAAMYAMTRFDGLFPQTEAEEFANDIFKNADDIYESDVREIREHIIKLYRRFLEQGSVPWEKPLLDFLAGLPAV